MDERRAVNSLQSNDLRGQHHCSDFLPDRRAAHSVGGKGHEKAGIFRMACALICALTACGKRLELVNMASATVGNLRGEQISFVDGDPDDRISAYKNHSTDEWLVLLLKEEGVTDIPDGLTAEYP
ncbi:MAG: hypothetical protein Q4E13_15070 [Clostridia bacterium]|nr:hypothetical protein [Clostridia bacterium]